MKKTDNTIRIAVAYEKGGVGKTTTAVNLAAELAKRGYKTLLMDTDFQAYASTYFGFSYTGNINDVITKNASPTEVIFQTKWENLDVLPSHRSLEGIEKYLISKEIKGENPNTILKQIMQEVDKQYDFVIIDCPPSGGYIKSATLVYADYLLLPTIPDDNALNGLLVVSEKVYNIKRTYNPNLEVLGLLITMYERTALKKAYTEALKKQNMLPCFDTVIRKNAALAEARNNNKPICQYRRTSNGCKDYEALATELIEKIGGVR